MQHLKPIQREFYLQNVLKVAPSLLGCFLVKGNQIGKIVETEAYGGAEDKASHASWRKREICLPMWGPAGHAYVYLTYGIHHLFNVVVGPEGVPGAVLIRALEPVANIREATNGPGRLTKALHITAPTFNGLDLTTGKHIFITHAENTDHFKIVASKRIGIAYAGAYAEKPWRFHIYGNPYVSRKEPQESK